MTDDQQRRVDGLLATYGEMRATLERLDERSDAHDERLDGVRASLRDAIARMEKALTAVGVECDRNSSRVEKKVDRQSERIDKLAEKLEALALSRSFTPAQYVTLLGPWGAAIIGGIVLLATKGSL
jgi:predicted  nucleic acid-binding Zn-ribbon protein